MTNAVNIASLGATGSGTTTSYNVQIILVAGGGAGGAGNGGGGGGGGVVLASPVVLSLIHISEPTRQP
jgi:hypothetical protein